MKTWSDIYHDIHSRFLDLKNLDCYISNSPEFKKAFENSSISDKEVCIQIIKTNKKDELINWVESQLKRFNIIEEYSMRELRSEARNLGVKYYGTKTRSALINEINECKV